MNTQREFRINQLKRLLEASPQDSFLRYALALEMFLSENYTEAEQRFLSLIADNPDYTATYYHLAKLYEQTGKTEQAVATYKQGIEVTQRVRDLHALSELRSALNELEFGDDF